MIIQGALIRANPNTSSFGKLARITRLYDHSNDLFFMKWASQFEDQTERIASNKDFDVVLP